MAEATYTKLRSGDWGIRVQGTTRVGETVTVRTKGGEAKKEIVEKILWEGDGIAVCAIVPTVKDRHAGIRPRTGGQCACTEQGCCRPRCQCERHCVCRGGDVYDCMG